MKKLLATLLAGAMLFIGCASMKAPAIHEGELVGKTICHFRGLEIYRYAVYTDPDTKDFVGLYAIVQGDMDEFNAAQKLGVESGLLEFLVAHHIGPDRWVLVYTAFLPFGRFQATLGVMTTKQAIAALGGKVTEADAEKFAGMVKTRWAPDTVFCPMLDQYDDFKYLMKIMLDYAHREYKEGQRP